MICFDFFDQDLDFSISLLRDVFNLHSPITVQYSEQRNRLVQTSEIFFFLTESYNKTENSNTSFGYLVFITKVIESEN